MGSLRTNNYRGLPHQHKANEVIHVLSAQRHVPLEGTALWFQSPCAQVCYCATRAAATYRGHYNCVATHLEARQVLDGLDGGHVDVLCRGRGPHLHRRGVEGVGACARQQHLRKPTVASSFMSRPHLPVVALALNHTSVVAVGAGSRTERKARRVRHTTGPALVCTCFRGPSLSNQSATAAQPANAFYVAFA